MEAVMKYTETIGIVGGMGSYATLDFFRRILDAFPAEKEWDRPRSCRVNKLQIKIVFHMFHF